MFPDARRGFQSRSGEEVADIDCLPYWMECRNRSHWRVQKWFEDLEAESSNSERPPTLVLKRPRKEPLIVMRFDDWLLQAGDAHQAKGLIEERIINGLIDGLKKMKKELRYASDSTPVADSDPCVWKSGVQPAPLRIHGRPGSGNGNPDRAAD